MNVAFSVRAELDLTDILDDLAAANLSAAYQLNSQLTQRINQLSRLPRMGRTRDDIEEGLRGLLIRPYVLFYRLEIDEIVIVRILHGSRDLGSVAEEEQ